MTGAEYKLVFRQFYKQLFWYFHRGLDGMAGLDQSITADDLTQLTMITVWEAVNRSTYAEYQVGALIWLKAKKILSQYSHKKVRQIYPTVLINATSVDRMSDAADYNLLQLELYKHVYTSVRETDQELLTLLWAGLSNTEISEILLIGDGALRTRICRLKAKIENVIARYRN